jgi:hypothetical protein
MRKAVGFFLIAASLVLAGVAPAVAQVQTGNLSIKAVDDQGAIMPGATVSITSPVLPRVEGVTGGRRRLQVPGLTPGTYTIRIALQGFQTYIREDVILKQDQTVSIEAPMKVGTLNEAITVKGESPVVDTRTVGSKTNIDSALLESTPGGKDIWNILEYKAPGVVVETPDVGGNQGGLQRSMSARGTPNGQNTQLLNGVNVNDPAAQGFSMNYYIPSAFDNIQVSTGAQDIAIGTGGVLINMVTKSGTNTFQGEGLQTYQSRGTQSANVDDNLLSMGFRPDANSTELISNSNFQLGGPLLKNRMFFFGSVNYQATHVNVPDFPSAVPSYIPTPLANTSAQDTTDIVAGEGKITYQLGPANPVRGACRSSVRQAEPGRRLGADAGIQFQGAGHFRNLSARLQPGAERAHVHGREGQLQQHALPVVSEDRSAAPDRPVEQQRALPEPPEQPDHVPAPGADDRQSAVLTCRTRRRPARVKGGFDNTRGRRHDPWRT